MSSTPDATGDDRPFGWGICAQCGEDCDDEADYNPLTRESLHPACERYRQNYEPPPPTLDDALGIRGGEEQAAMREAVELKR